MDTTNPLGSITLLPKLPSRNSVLVNRSPPNASVLVRPAITVRISSVESPSNSPDLLTTFHLLVVSGLATWSLWRNYSEFQALQLDLYKVKLKQSLPLLPLWKDPGFKFVPPWKRRRRVPPVLMAQKLEHYLIACLDLPLLRANLELRRFLGDTCHPVVLEDESIRAHQYELLTYPTTSTTLNNSMTELSEKKSRETARIIHISISTANSDPSPPSVNFVDQEDGTTSLSLSDFSLLQMVGKGSFGKVLMAEHVKSGKIYAIKAISKKQLAKKPHEIKRIMTERNILRQNVNHPFLLGLHGSFQSERYLYLCVDYVNGGELFFHLQRERKFDENRARFYISEIVSALEYLHGMGIIYRDLKPENCLLDSQGHIRIVDFGLAKDLSKLSNPHTRTFCGTPEYLAPEVLRREPYSFAVDWYCLGALAHEMVVGLPPFYSKNRQEMFRRILFERLLLPGFLSPEIQDFLRQLLTRIPQCRLGDGPNGAQHVKNHAFFEGVEWELVNTRRYEPPFKPQLDGHLDTRNFDPMLTLVPIPNSLKQAKLGSEEIPLNLEGFTYNLQGEYLPSVTPLGSANIAPATITKGTGTTTGAVITGNMKY